MENRRRKTEIESLKNNSGRQESLGFYSCTTNCLFPRTVAASLLRFHQFWAKARDFFSFTLHGLSFGSVQNFHLFQRFWQKASKPAPGTTCQPQMVWQPVCTTTIRVLTVSICLPEIQRPQIAPQPSYSFFLNIL